MVCFFACRAKNLSTVVVLLTKYKIMSMYQIRGDWDIKYFRKRASTAFAANSMVTLHSDDDTITPAVSSSGSLVGIVLKNVASTDSDYAANTRIPVAVPRNELSEFMADDIAADIAVTDEGELHDLIDADTVNPEASTESVIRLKQFVAARKGIYSIVRNPYSSTPLAL